MVSGNLVVTLTTSAVGGGHAQYHGPVHAGRSGKRNYLASISPAITQTVTAPATKLGFVAAAGSPANTLEVTAGKPFSLTVYAQNAAGATVTNYTGTATVTVTSVQKGGSLTFTSTTVNFLNGMANFTGTVNLSGTYTVKITSGSLTAIAITISTGGRQLGNPPA